MKKYLTLPLFLLFLACGNRGIDYPWANISYENALANAGEKLIMLDFYTET